MYRLLIFFLSCVFGREFMQNLKFDLDAHKAKYSKSGDIKRNSKSLFISMLNPVFELVVSYRVYSRLFKSKSVILRKLSLLIYSIAYRRFGCDIHPAATIGVPVKIGHCSDIVIGPLVVIGKNCYIFNGVTIGNKYVGEKNGMPTVGNNVILGTNSKILGDIAIESDATIGALTLVIKNVRSGCTMVGIPGREIKS